MSTIRSDETFNDNVRNITNYYFRPGSLMDCRHCGITSDFQIINVKFDKSVTLWCEKCRNFLIVREPRRAENIWEFGGRAANEFFFMTGGRSVRIV